MNLLVAAHRALLRSLSTCLWDPPAVENCGRASRRLQQNFRGRHILSSPRCLPNQAETGECVWQVQSQRLEAPRCLPTCTHKSQIKWHIFAQHLQHAQVVLHERLTLPCTITVGYSALFSATFILYWPIRSHRVFGWSDPAYACVCQSPC